MKTSWDPNVYQCGACGTTIFSRFPGHFSTCKCPGDNYIFVDQTEHYERRGGDPNKFIILKRENNNVT